TFDLVARRAESPLCGVVTIHDAAGKEVARTEASESADPARLAFSPSADGTYTMRVAEKFRGRGGPNLLQPLRVTDGTALGEPGFRLSVASDVFTVARGGTLKVKLTVERFGGFGGPIAVTAADLPKGVTAKGVVIAANQTSGELTLNAGADAVISS